MRARFEVSALASIVLAALAGYGCGNGGSPPATSQAAKPAAAQATAPAQPAKPATIADLFPPGAGRNQVLDNCASCHPVACSARGQRTAERWDSLREGHRDKVSGASAGDLDTMFAYLKQNFNDRQPEPQIPAEFLQGSCTPF